MASLVLSRVKFLVTSWSQVPILSTGDFNFHLSSTKILSSCNFSSKMLFAPMLAFHVSYVCQQPPPAVLLFFHFHPKRPFKFWQRPRLQSSFGLTRLFVRLYWSLKARMTDMVAAAQQPIAHTRISVVFPMCNPC